MSTEEIEKNEANYVEKPFPTENYKEIETAEVHGDQRVWVKPADELFTEQIKEEILDKCEFQTIVDVKNEIEEQEEQVEENCVKIEPITIKCEPIESPTIEIPLPKIPIPRLAKINANKKVKKPRGRMGRRPRPILPMTQASVTTPLLEPTATPHLIVPSPQMPGIAYQIFLGDHGKNPNNQVQYTMLQSQPLFLQQTSTSGTTPSSVVISQPSMVIDQTYQAQLSSAKNAKMAGQSYCPFCYNCFTHLNEHSKQCWANPASKNYKKKITFRRIAPSTSF